ncbi:MAG: FecR family protein [Cephaloticoccus sp.]|nr:FecR family protein [Cephaloticoccus sp.]MCF7759872.1 FecR family protein [Cephaloticoccus sp.]
MKNILLFALLGSAVQAANPLALEESVVIEAVNDVTHIAMPSGRTEPAIVQLRLQSPDLLQTGRQSRAELEAADGTITRLGANTLFAFDRATRTLQLERGSLLFHSPTGRGGGTVRSPSASASVLGTTIIAAATPDGGFKLLVLEGRAQVDFANGNRQQLNAGQLSFVRPGVGGIGTPGPVMNFDLAQLVSNSRLVQGFKRPLPSAGKIDQAVQQQSRSVGQGKYITTGFLVFTATSDTQVNGIEAAGPDADDTLKGAFSAHQRLALNTPVTLQSSSLPEVRMFREPLLVPSTEEPFLNLESDILITGLLGSTITVNSPSLSLAGWNVPGFNLVGKQSVNFLGSTSFDDLSEVDYIRIFSPLITVPQGATLTANFPATSTLTTFYFDTSQTLSLSGGSISNLTGGLLLQSHDADLLLDHESLHAGGPIGAATVVPSAINIDAPLGRLVVNGGTMRAVSGNFAALARELALTGTTFELAGDFWADSGTTAQLENLTFTNLPAAAVFQTTAVDAITLLNMRFNGFTEINLGARTLALEDVHFPDGSIVRLVSEQGQLAPQPNTGQTVQPGMVNFVHAVTYADQPAQDFVAKAAGGTGQQANRITISTPQP